MMEGFVDRTVDVDGVRIACSVGGSGPPVLLLHGYPQCRALWARVGPILAARHTVVAADLRGYGDSDKPRSLPDASNYAFRAMAADQVGLMRRLGFPRFHLVGHDRGGRVAHRLALDHPDAVASLALLDIVPTHAVYAGMNRTVALTYWHWPFLAQPEPLPERLIGADPDFFYETCLVGWGAAKLADFDPDQLAAYRRAWRDPAMIHASSSDYRAAARIDLAHDEADLGRTVGCPALVLYGSAGALPKMFDVEACWRPRLADMTVATLPAGHFLIDGMPGETAAILLAFLARAA